MFLTGKTVVMVPHHMATITMPCYEWVRVKHFLEHFPAIYTSLSNMHGIYRKYILEITNNIFYLIAREGKMNRILQSDCFPERIEFSYIAPAGCTLPDEKSFSYLTLGDELIFTVDILHKFITFSLEARVTCRSRF